MRAGATELGFTAVPALRYRDLPAAIDWLCTTLGFERQLIVEGEDGAIRYAQLTLGTAMVMLVPVRDSAFDQLMVQPDEIGGAETQVTYFYVSDADAYCAQVKAAGAEVVLDLADKDHRGRGFSCRDPEGHLWTFGSYDPWRSRPAAHASRRPPAKMRGFVGGLSLAVAGSLAAGGFAYTTGEHVAPTVASAAISDAGPAQEGARASQPTTGAARARTPADASASVPASNRLPEVEAEQEEAELRAALVAAASAREAAERARRESLEKLAREQSAKQAAEQALEEAHAKLVLERSQREAAERAARALRVRLLRLRDESEESPYGEGITSLFEAWTRNDG
ncbi:MAG TPA: VOC family protein [Hyphomicrobiaceae bacterium]|nr:VOC family protein [Hyphomicrobiaceae bacterium]